MRDCHKSSYLKRSQLPLNLDMGWILFLISLIILFSVVGHEQCGCEDAGVISETWSSSSPVERDLVQCGGDL